jgi:hypothetical protein
VLLGVLFVAFAYRGRIYVVHITYYEYCTHASFIGS